MNVKNETIVLGKYKRYSAFPLKPLLKNKEADLNPMDIFTLIKVNFHDPNYPIEYCLLGMDDLKANRTDEQMKEYQNIGKARCKRLQKKKYKIDGEKKEGYIDRKVNKESPNDPAPIYFTGVNEVMAKIDCYINYNPKQKGYIKKTRWEQEVFNNYFVKIPSIFIERHGYFGIDADLFLFIVCLMAKGKNNPIKDSDDIFPYGPKTVRKRRKELHGMGLAKAVKDRKCWRYNLNDLHLR